MYAIRSYYVLIVGHAINIFMSGLGSMVHPLRLTFVEFYKNGPGAAAISMRWPCLCSAGPRITSYNVCYTKLLRIPVRATISPIPI